MNTQKIIYHMLVNKKNSNTSRVKFISYTGEYPNLCSGVLTLEIDGVQYKFGHNFMEHHYDKDGNGYYADEENWYECPFRFNVRGVCPEHWHVPRWEEFEWPLGLTYYNRETYANQLLYGRGTGFDILLAGYYNSMEKIYGRGGEKAYLWFASENYYETAISDDFPYRTDIEWMKITNKDWKYMAYSLRCVKDEIEE